MTTNLTTATLIAAICVLSHGEQSGSCETNMHASCGTPGGELANAWSEASREMQEVREIIAHAPDMLLRETNKRRYGIRDTCEKISRCPDVPTRYRLFRELMASACQIRFDKIEDLVPVDFNIQTNSQGERIHTLNERTREWEVARLLGNVYGQLDCLADKIFDSLLLEKPMPAPGIELFEPYFKLIEKLQEEERRVGVVHRPLSRCEQKIDHLEYMFNFIYLKVMEVARKTPDLKDRMAVEERFRQIVGRPIRSPERYMADSRRRVEETIREEKEREEANRRRLERGRQQGTRENMSR